MTVQSSGRRPMTTTDPEVQRKILNRLKRAQGQLAAVISAVEREEDCRTVVTQLSAVSSALDRAGFQIIATAMKDCLADPDQPDDERSDVSMQELEKLFLSLA